MGVLPANNVRQRLSRRATPSTVRRRVRLPELALGTALVVAGALGSVLWATRAPDQRVLVAARDLHRGDVVGADTLRWAAVSGDHLAGLTDPAALEGRLITGDVEAGAPVVAANFRSARLVATDEVGIGVSLERGTYPPDLAVGDEVQLVVTRIVETAAGMAESEVIGSAVHVYSIEGGDTAGDGRVLVGLVVKQADVVAVVTAQRINLVRTDLGGSWG